MKDFLKYKNILYMYTHICIVASIAFLMFNLFMIDAPLAKRNRSKSVIIIHPYFNPYAVIFCVFVWKKESQSSFHSGHICQAPKRTNYIKAS